MKGNSFLTRIDTSVIYPQLKNDSSSIYSLLLVEGYLKVVSSNLTYGKDYLCEVAIPNKEISFVYSKEILSMLKDFIPKSSGEAISNAIILMDKDKLEKTLEDFLLQTISLHDANSQSFYHNLILGICALTDNYYRIISNRESGHGRFDIQMLPLNPKLPAILIELKAAKKADESQLEDLANKALVQINNREYYANLKGMKNKSIIKMGISFSGKNAKIATERQEN